MKFILTCGGTAGHINPALAVAGRGALFMLPQFKPVLAVMQEVTVKGVSHITGGGFYENIPRSLKDGCCARIAKADVRTPALFGLISEHDMFNTFNMGVGMVLTVAAADAGKAIDILQANGQEAYRLGVIAEGEGVELV